MAQLGEKLDPAQQVKVMGERNFGMHLKDHDNKRKTDVVFGDPTGVLDVAGGAQGAQGGEVHGLHQHRVRGEPGRPVAGHEEVRGVRQGGGEEARLSASRVGSYNVRYVDPTPARRPGGGVRSPLGRRSGR